MNENSTENKQVWEKPVLQQLDINDTANGSTGPDGQGGGSQQGGNMSGSPSGS